MERNYSQAGVIVNFSKSDMGVYAQTSSSDSTDKYGKIKLFSIFALRILSLIRGEDQKRLLAEALSTAQIDQILEQMQEAYRSEYNLKEVSFYTRLLPKAKKQFSLIVNYDSQGHTTRLKPKGFGLLGKGIDLYSMMAVCALYCFLLENHQDDNDFVEKLNFASKSCGQSLLTHRSINAQAEFDISESIAKSCYQI